MQNLQPDSLGQISQKNANRKKMKPNSNKFDRRRIKVKENKLKKKKKPHQTRQAYQIQ
jgi:hypothetical protein